MTGQSSQWKTANWFVSHYNFSKEARRGLKLPKQVRVHDITLRDGEQQAGIVIRKDEKIRVARALDEAGVDRIEAGMPAVSKEDAEAVKAIANDGLNSKVFAFARCAKSDVDLALKADVDGLVMEVPSSDHIIKYAYDWPEEKAIDLSVEATAYAHEHGLYVTFFTIDSSRATFKACWKLVNAVATKGHMDSLTVVDTMGVCSPQGFANLVRTLRKKVRKPLEVHCHNDFGLAVANTIAGVGEGAEVIHTTVNAIGERMGNASLEQSVMALRLLYGVKSGIKLEKLVGLSRVIEEVTGQKVPVNAPVVGNNIFKTESGIITGWWAKSESQGMPLEVFPFLPELVGHDPVKILLGKKSGRDSVFYVGGKLGLSIPETAVDKILENIKTTAEANKRALTEEEFVQIVEDVKQNQ
ncbi:MAG: pyruvate carboxyltransferase [Candidatus Bathyarchaeia archaeon]